MSSRTFNQKELDLIYGTIEHFSEFAYRRGQDDQVAGKSLKTEDFKLSKATKLQIKTNLIKALGGR